MPDGIITTREALAAHYGEPKGHIGRKEMPRLNTPQRGAADRWPCATEHRPGTVQSGPFAGFAGWRIPAI
jgi:hypothetical protein